MALEHRFDDDERLLVITGTSLPAVQAARQSLAMIGVDPRVAILRGALILVAPDAPPPAGVDVLVMSGMLSSLTHLIGGPVAIVVSGPKHESAASMMALAGDRLHRVEYFSSEAEARAWLKSEASQ